MGEGDEWPSIHEKLTSSEILIMAVPTWIGQPSSISKLVLERMDAMMSETDDEDRPVAYNRVAGVAVSGNEDGAHHVIAEINGALQAAATSGPLAGVLDFSDEPLVSIDLNHNPASSTIDSLETAVLEGKLVRVVSWYDNEWGFSNRMVDTASVMARLV